MTPPPPYGFIRGRFTNPSANPAAYPQARLHNQWPEGEEALDQFMAAQGGMIADLARAHADMQRCGIALLEKIGPAVLLTHSAGGPFGWLVGDARPDLVKGIMAVEPLGPPFVDHPTGKLAWGIAAIPLDFQPPGPLVAVERPAPGPDLLACKVQAEPARQLPNLAQVPVALVTAEASWKAREDHGVVDFLRQAGVDCAHIRLEERGLHGNGHMMMLENNSDAIAALLADWIETRFG